MESIEKGDLLGMCGRMGNVLESVTAEKYPQILRVKELMKQEGAIGSLMSGSGPTVFGIFVSRESAEKAQKKFSDITVPGRQSIVYKFKTSIVL